ncbi:MAG: histone deacetylase [Dehalococcoidia bacterium]|nr:MAG: histone deacetylase [Dehalococcoidia bacterium]
MRVGYVYDPIYLKHDTGNHPENANRVAAIMRYLERTGSWQQINLLKPRLATMEEISLVHTKQYISEVEALASRGGGQLDLDTIVSPDSYNVALYAAGGTIQAVDAVINGSLNSAFALVRPPGHHASTGRGMGFCLFNNVAIAVAYILHKYKLERIVIVDFDVHHGNGTQDVFYSNPRVLYISTHQTHHYPGTGSVDQIGEGEARGTTINIPLPSGCGDEEYNQVFGQIIIPAIRCFGPKIIVVSAGYDGHWSDGLAGMHLSIAGFVQMTRIIKQLADELCDGRLVFSLEGGYNLTALSASVGATFEVLLGKEDIEDKLGQLSLEDKAPNITGLMQLIKGIHCIH